MAKPRLLLTHSLFEPAIALLAPHFEMDVWRESFGIPREELFRRIADKDALICLLSDKVNEELLGHAPKLRIAATVSVGYDNLDVPACTRHGVAATNTPGVLDDTTADFAWTLLMAVARRLIEGETWIRSGQWPGWDLAQLCGTDIWGKTLGIWGFGRIGREVARRSLGFKMRVIYHSNRRAPEDVERELHAEYVERDRLIAESDFLSLHVPLTADTRHMISAEVLRRMKRTAFLINTTRGPVVDEAALAAALAAGEIAGAGLDVFEREPIVNPALIPLKNVVLAPHMGSASLETRTKMAVMAAGNCVALFQGERPPNVLNPEAVKI